MSLTLSPNSMRWNNKGVEMLYGKFPTTRKGWFSLNKVVKSNFKASASIIVNRSGCGTRPGKPAAKSRSSSTTVKASHSPTRGAVNAAKPGPISTIFSPLRGATERTILAITRWSCKKFCPKRFRV